MMVRNHVSEPAVLFVVQAVQKCHGNEKKAGTAIAAPALCSDGKTYG
jgi:hypothetical protein